jgi:cardiolipin synthase
VTEYVGGNRLTLLQNGEEYFPALVAALDAAKAEIFLETYIFADDATGARIAAALARAAARGVATHLLLDGFGARDFAPHLRSELEQAGAQVLVFRPQVSPWPPWRQRYRMRRMHRKLACVDGAVAFIGGINVIDDFEDSDGSAPRFDYAVRIEGPLVPRVRADAAHLWQRVAWAVSKRRWTAFGRRVRGAGAPAPGAEAGTQRAALMVRDSMRHRSDIEESYLEMIGMSRHEVLIACAYFFPGRRFRRALTAAARRRVHVTLLLQGRVEYTLLHYASRAMHGTLLAAGVHIHEYHLSFLHAKVAVFDGRYASVGSSNIDPFSLLLAREANVFVDDEGFALRLRESLLKAMRKGARPVPLRRWRRMPFLMRARIWLSYRIARWLLAYYGYDRGV